jgi:hypothetical protein
MFLAQAFMLVLELWGFKKNSIRLFGVGFKIIKFPRHTSASTGSSHIEQILCFGIHFRLSNESLHVFEDSQPTQGNHVGRRFGVPALESSRKQILLYDVESCKL